MSTLMGVLKPMPQYASHNRAGVEFTRHGREYIVDHEAQTRIPAMIKALSEEHAKKLAETHGDPDEAHKLRQEYEPKIAKLKSGVIEEPGKPLVFTEKGFDYIRAAFGVQLVNDSWDGQPRPIEAKPLTDKEMQAQIVDTLARIEKRLSDLESKPGARVAK